MSIWFDPDLSLEKLQAPMDGKLVLQNNGIAITEVGPDYIRGTLEVDERNHQWQGVLHGGVSCVMGETLGSVAANMTLDLGREVAMGVEINASHLRPVRSGTVTGTARPLKLGHRLQVWEIRLENAEGQLTCIIRLTMAVLPSGASNRPPNTQA